MDLSIFSKLSPVGILKADVPPETSVTAIVKVSSANYVPPNVSLVSRIDPFIFTARFTAKDLIDLEADKRVKSISLSEPLKIIE